MRPPLEHRVPGHPDYFYYRASGGFWLYGPDGFIGVFTRRDLTIHLEETCAASTDC